jgi:hypothetical protein
MNRIASIFLFVGISASYYLGCSDSGHHHDLSVSLPSLTDTVFASGDTIALHGHVEGDEIDMVHLGITRLDSAIMVFHLHQHVDADHFDIDTMFIPIVSSTTRYRLLLQATDHEDRVDSLEHFFRVDP